MSLYKAVNFNVEHYNLYEIFYSFPKILFKKKFWTFQNFDSYFDKLYEKFTRNVPQSFQNAINLFTLNSP